MAERPAAPPTEQPKSGGVSVAIVILVIVLLIGALRLARRSIQPFARPLGDLVRALAAAVFASALVIGALLLLAVSVVVG